MATALDIIKRAMRLARVLGQGEQVSADDADICLIALNQMLDNWRAERLFAYHVRIEQFLLVPGIATYTIGAGGQFNTSRPTRIEGGYTRFQGVDYPLAEETARQYDHEPLKTIQTTWPEYFYFEPSFPLATITLSPAPSVAATIHLRTWAPLANLALTDVITLPQGYEHALTHSLAEEIAPEFGVSLLPDVSRKAAAGRKTLRTNNWVPGILVSDVAHRSLYTDYMFVGAPGAGSGGGGGGGGVTPPPGPTPVATSIIALSGNGASSASGMSIVARVLDQFGSAIASALVNAVVISGPATIAPGSDLSASNGDVDFVVTPTGAGAIVVRLTLASNGATVDFNLTGTAVVGGVVAAPEITLLDTTPDTIQMTSATAGATIRYVMAVSPAANPGPGSTLYSGVFTPTDAAVEIRAYATLAGLTDSSVTIMYYTPADMLIHYPATVF